MNKVLIAGLVGAVCGCASLEGEALGRTSAAQAMMPATGGRPVLEAIRADRVRDKWLSGRYRGDAHRSWGLRGGYLVPMSEKQADWDPTVLYGAFVRMLPRGQEYELGVDVSLADSETGEISSTLVAVRVDRIFARGRSSGAYFLGGGQILVEEAENKTLDMTKTMWAANVNVGAGARALGKRLDLRGTYSLVLGSENVQAVLLGTLSLLF